MKGPGLITLFSDLLTGGGGKTRVLTPSGINADGSLQISASARAKAVRQLEGG